jgi:hypothetical protein
LQNVHFELHFCVMAMIAVLGYWACFDIMHNKMEFEYVSFVQRLLEMCLDEGILQYMFIKV